VARLRASSRTALRRRFGVVPQDLALVEDRSALANVALALEIDGVPRARRRHRAAEALRAVDAPADADAPAVSALPMAARQRVAWARAFVRNPDLLIADQPTSHQDADGAERFAALTAALAAAGTACVVLAREPHLVAAAARRDWRTLTIHQRRIVDVDTLLADQPDGADEIDASLHVIAEIDRLDPDNIVPFPVVRSASGGHRG
jgi:ABC-type ATPase involved in cell division